MKKKYLGLTLIEILVSSTLLLIILSGITSFLWSYFIGSNKVIEKVQLRNSLSKIALLAEKEILPGSEVVYKFGTFTTGKNTLILSVPAMDKNGITLFNPVTMAPKTDMIILYKENDGKPLNRKYNGLSLNSGRLKLKIITQPQSNRKPIVSQVLFANLSPNYTDGNYILPEKLSDSGMFKYFSAGKVEIAPVFPKDISLIRFTLWGELRYRNSSISEIFESELKLKNKAGRG